MSTCVSMARPSEPQGIGSILGSECERPKTAASLRRTLSADMSSKKWLANHGLSPLKTTEEFPELERPGQLEIWDSIQSEEKKKEEEPGPGQLDIWSSILSQKTSSLPAPYIHPLVKRSGSSLSEKSLQICTESLGSETGSDGFSSYAPSEISDTEQEEEEEEEEEEEKESQLGVVNYSCSVSRKSPPRSFPPPLPSLSRPGLHMRPHRKDGRLVLEAVPVSSHNYFHAQRQGGRLLLTFINSPSNEINNEEGIEAIEEEEEVKLKDQDEVESDEEFEEETEEIKEEKKEVVDRGIWSEVDQPPIKLPTEMMSVHRSVHVVNKLIGLTNRNPTWSHKSEKKVEDEEATTPLPQSLPSQPPRLARLISSPTKEKEVDMAATATVTTAATASLNTYEYYWRSKPVAAMAGIHALTQQPPRMSNGNNNNNHNNNKFLVSKYPRPQEQQELVVLKGNKADCLVTISRGCKEPRRSLTIFEPPHCIATS